MKKTLGVLVAAVAVASAACDKDSMPIKTTSTGEVNVSPAADSAEARGHSMVRVVNAVQGGKEVAVQMGEITLFADVKPGSVTDYREVTNNLATFSVRDSTTGDGRMVDTNDQLLVDGNRYTIFLIAEDVSKSVLRIVGDDVIPDSGKARIRVLHAAAGAPDVDISMVGARDALFTGVEFKDLDGFEDVDPAKVTLEVRARGRSTVLLRIPDVDLRRGTSTTIVLTGAEKLRAFKFTDAVMAESPAVAR
jgi:Domain of unknown function (DUF4397)